MAESLKNKRPVAKSFIPPPSDNINVKILKNKIVITMDLAIIPNEDASLSQVCKDK